MTTPATINDRIAAMGVTIPDAAAPAANYVPWRIQGSTLFTSGQLPLDAGALKHTGIVGKDVSLEDAQDCAKWCAINILAQAKAALGDLEKIKQLTKITVFVASDPAFTSQHLVANGASNFLVEALGDIGRHARSAVGVPALPLNAPVEIEAIFEI